MTHPVRKVDRTDDVDRIVDSLLADPDRAEDVKSLLRRRLMDPGPVRFKPVVIPRSQASEDVEDMWDNVPV